jgi:hypothetical protein
MRQWGVEILDKRIEGRLFSLIRFVVWKGLDLPDQCGNAGSVVRRVDPEKSSLCSERNWDRQRQSFGAC